MGSGLGIRVVAFQVLPKSSPKLSPSARQAFPNYPEIGGGGRGVRALGGSRLRVCKVRGPPPELGPP